MKAIEDEVVPVGFIDDGQEDNRETIGGQVWEVMERTELF
jgi:hypothetical protein